MKSRISGFTLLELMIVVVVIGILATIAYPNYQEFARRGHRSAAQSHMLDIAQRQQQYFTDARAYAATVTDLGITTPAEVSKFYTIAIVVDAGPPPGFTITATPKSGSIQAPDGNLSIDNSGKKTPSTKW
jgi:type IV pilus assembly protein PilE